MGVFQFNCNKRAASIRDSGWASLKPYQPELLSQMQGNVSLASWPVILGILASRRLI